MVKTVTDRQTGAQYACKIMSLPPPGKVCLEGNESSRTDIFKEIDILISLKHPNIVNMKGGWAGGWSGGGGGGGGAASHRAVREGWCGGGKMLPRLPVLSPHLSVACAFYLSFHAEQLGN